jgi:hypothetical protein
MERLQVLVLSGDSRADPSSRTAHATLLGYPMSSRAARADRTVGILPVGLSRYHLGFAVLSE